MSLVIHCKDQKEVDYYWKTLTADGGEESMCGWLKDKYGLSWQVVPTILSNEMRRGGDPARLNRMMKVVLQSVKLDIAKLAAAAG